MPDQTRIDEIRTRANAATAGPWQNDQAEINQGLPGAPDIWIAWIGEALNIDDLPQSNNNATFVAHAREDIPWLLAEHARLTAEVTELAAMNVALERGIKATEEASNA